MATALAAAACAVPASRVTSDACAAGARQMARVELIFGLGLQDDSGISEAEWQRFLADEVTPRFPDGLTAYDAYGQWQHPDRGIVRLRSKVLQIWYVMSRADQEKIDAIRAAFKARFSQLSVMRIDGADCVSF
jgi:hypothetical protein